MNHVERLRLHSSCPNKCKHDTTPQAKTTTTTTASTTNNSQYDKKKKERMSDGGVFPWKRQKIVAPPVADYGSLSKPLPEPPEGSAWRRDPETREWQLVPQQNHQRSSTGSSTNTSITDSSNKNNSSKRGGANKNRNDAESTVDSTVEYVEHTVLPTDTLQGICLKYKISSRALKRANGNFSGSYLLLAPEKLFIPISKQALESGSIRPQSADSEDSKRYSFLAEFSNLSSSEANW